MNYDTGDYVAGCALVFLGLLLLGIFGGVGTELAQDYRSYDAQVACKTKRMEPVRRAFSTHVTCVPAIMRQDTTTVNINGKVAP